MTKSAQAQANIHLNTNGVSSIMWPFKSPPEQMEEVCGSSFHFGEDYFADDWFHKGGESLTCGEPLYSPISGHIIFTGIGVENYGNQVIIQSDTDPRFAVRLAHMQSISKKVTSNQKISAGTYIGKVGKTGAQSCHLHLVLYQNLNAWNLSNLKEGWSANYEHYYDVQGGKSNFDPTYLAARFNVDVPNPWSKGRGSRCNGGPHEP
ncbi:MAG: hypothetical protein CMK59_06485 [Proteobacteria bacterium]|nr:hypothetical protein [Pseudomonadota bacterium]